MDKNTMTKEEIRSHALAFLRENNTLVLSTMSPEGKPHSALMYFIVKDDFTFHCIGFKESNHALHMEKNKHVAIVVGFGPESITLQAQGKVEFCDDEKDEDYLKIVNKINYSNIDQIPIFRIGKGGFFSFKIKPTKMKWLNLDKKGHPQAYQKGFHIIIP